MKALIITILSALAVLVFILISGMVYTVSETQQVIITQFGEPKGEPVRTAGLKFKTPFLQKANRFEKRVLEWDGRPNEMPTKDKTFIVIDTFGRWQISDPLQFFLRLRDERSAQSRLDDILGSETRNAVANHELIELVRTTKDRTPAVDESLGAEAVSIATLGAIRKGRQKLEEEIFTNAAPKLEEFGITLLEIRFKRINYHPDVRDTIYQRMISERQQIADRFRSEGEGEAARILGDKERELLKIESEAYRTVEEIKGKADAEATSIYAKAYNQSPIAAEFYGFLKSMELYENALGSDTSVILSTDSDLFRFFKETAESEPQAAPAGVGSGL